MKTEEATTGLPAVRCPAPHPINFTFIYSSVTVFLVLYRSGIRHEQDAEPGEEEIRMNS